MDAAEVVPHEVNCDRVRVVLDFFAKAIGQSGEPARKHPAHAHPRGFDSEKRSGSLDPTGEAEKALIHQAALSIMLAVTVPN